MLIVPMLASSALGRELYVSSSRGDDKNAGTSAQHPWRTFQKLSGLAAGDTVHLLPGDKWVEPLQLLGPGAGCTGPMRGLLEQVVMDDGGARVSGWLVDSASRGGRGAVPFRVAVDGEAVLEGLANLSRPDLPKAGVAPDPLHGFDVVLPPAAAGKLRKSGVHCVSVLATGKGAGCGPFAWPAPLTPTARPCFCDGKPCDRRPGAPPPLRVVGGGEGQSRATIQLNGSGVGISVLGFASVEVIGVEVADADRGVDARGLPPLHPGHFLVDDCVFTAVWNRSSIGQVATLRRTRDCSNGWTESVRVGGFANATIMRSLFRDIDVAVQESGEVALAAFVGNTVTGANGNTLMMTGRTEWQVANNVFSRDSAVRFFQCGTTDIMIGGVDTNGTITGNEIGWRGEHPAAPDGCGIDFEGGSDGVSVVENVIHDSWGAGVMVFGLSDKSRNISNASILRNVFVRNGAIQTSDDRGEVAFMEVGSTGECSDNIFFASDPSDVLRQAHNGTAAGFRMHNNSIRGLAALSDAMADTPAIAKLAFSNATGAAQVLLESRRPRPGTTVLWTLDGSRPKRGAPGTNAAPLVANALEVTVPRTAALNVQFEILGLPLPSLTMTAVISVPVL